MSNDKVNPSFNDGIPAVVTEEMIDKAVEVWKHPKRMHTNTSEGSLRDRMKEVLETVLGSAEK